MHHLLNVTQKLIDGATMDDTANLDLVMSINNLMEYSSKSSKITKVYGFIIMMKQLILMMILKILTIINLSSICLNY